MKTINLSEANIGDKFRTRYGRIVKYVGEDQDIDNEYKFLIEDETGFRFHFYKYGNYMPDEKSNLDLVEQIT